MLTFLICHRVAFGIHLDISADIATLLFDGSRHYVGMNVRLCLVEVNLKADDILLAVHSAHELVAVQRPFLYGWQSLHVPVVPGLRITGVVHFLVTERQFLHPFRAARQDDLNVCVLLVGRSSLVLSEIDLLKHILVAFIQRDFLATQLLYFSIDNLKIQMMARPVIVVGGIFVLTSVRSFIPSPSFIFVSVAR